MMISHLRSSVTTLLRKWMMSGSAIHGTLSISISTMIWKEPSRQLAMKLCKAIVFNTNTGFSGSYARMLSDETGIPVFSLKQACHHLSKGDEVFFLGWVMGSRIMGLAKARKQFNLAGIASVGMINEEKAIAEIRKAN